MKLEEYVAEARGNNIGLANAICELLGISNRSLVSKLIYGKQTMTNEIAEAIENITEGKVTRKELCADWRVRWPDLARISKIQRKACIHCGKLPFVRDENA